MKNLTICLIIIFLYSPSLISKKKVYKPNAKILYHDVKLMPGPSEKGRPLLVLPEGYKIRVSRRMKNNFIYTLVIQNGKKYTGWVHVVNIHASQKLIKKIVGHHKEDPFENTNYDNNENQALERKDESRVTLRPIERTLVLPAKLNLVTWGLNIAQSSFNSGDISVNSSKFVLSLNIQYSVNQKLDFVFNIPYRFKEQTRYAQTNQISKTKTSGFEDFRIAFKNKFLSQKKLIDIVLEAGWKSGFMSSTIPTSTSDGAAGTGSHDFYGELTFGKSLASWTPHFSIGGERTGSATRHTSDNSATKKYKPNYAGYMEFGGELPQFLPLIIIGPYLGYRVDTKREVEIISSSTTNTYIDIKRSLYLGSYLYIYKGNQTYVFNYHYTKPSAYSYEGARRSGISKHNFSIGLRF